MTKRKQLLLLIDELSELKPDYRFGQLLMNLLMLKKPPDAETIWNAEDDQLIDAARELILIHRERQKSVA